MNLEDVDASAWSRLEAAATDPQSAFRFLTLCSVDSAGHPQARTVVLRRADRAERLLEIHTDTRSPKWRELSGNPIVTVLGFCPSTRVQLRLLGVACLHPPGSDLAERAWRDLSSWTRSTYTGGPPGDEASGGESRLADGCPEADGKGHFGVITLRAGSLDWFELRRIGNRRAVFQYDQCGGLTAARWVNP